MFCAIVSIPKRLQINNPRSNMRFIIQIVLKLHKESDFFLNVQIFPDFTETVSAFISSAKMI
ncbi:hypothetical protein DW921_06665 [Phocaeicola coprophilus]|uniref:Uncharacterized protein n=1 Tax=Phocaeicola coprophilus TaxID=387090 RepID=A0A413T0U6_9BACT|nr:hypothetical protein DW921_06665 [Phocaeicola coprophilus]